MTNKRINAFLLAVCLLLTASGARVLFISLDKSYAVSDSYNSYALTIDKKYTQIVDQDQSPLTNYKNEYVAVIKPNEKCMSELPQLFNKDEIKEITDELSKGYPVIREVDNYKKTKYIQIYTRTVQNPSDMLCRQLLDISCGGLETYTNKVVSETKINFAVDALGRVLTGDSSEVTTETTDAPEQVKITIEREVQEMAEKAASGIEKGAVVVLDANTSRMLACVSKPNDYYNRAISPYCVGSIFKLIVASCALENGIDSQYECKGSITVGDTTYACQNDNVHGKEHICEALENSCNCYFVNLALKLGREKLYKTASDFGFGSSTRLYDGWDVSNGNLPSLSVLQSDGQLALLGFGQGALTDTPYHFALAVAAIANGGVYKTPSLTGKEVVEEKRVMSEKNAETLLSYMRSVVEKGTGVIADYKGKSAGKTATAQSGQYVNGKEILHTYFAGVYPYDDPEYVIVVMNEDGKSGSGDCGPVFRNLVEMLETL